MLFHKISGIVLSSLFRFSFSKTFYWLKACFDNEDVVVHSLKFSSSFNWKFRHREPCFSLNYLNYHGNWFFFSWADAACLFSLHFLENCLPQIFHLSGFFFSWTDLTCWASESVEKSITNVRPKRLKTLNNYHQNHLLTLFFFFFGVDCIDRNFADSIKFPNELYLSEFQEFPPLSDVCMKWNFQVLRIKNKRHTKKGRRRRNWNIFFAAVVSSRFFPVLSFPSRQLQ